MQKYRHIFVHVVNRPDDPFYGIQESLRRATQGHEIVELRLPSRIADCVQKVEYSQRRKVRFLFYKEVFEQLTRKLDDLLADNCPSVIYFSDEGVWAEFLRDFRSKRPNRQILAINVQHGFEYRVRPRPNSLRVRRWLNALCYRFRGHPVFGFGSFGGVGGGVFDLYLAYDEATASYISDYTGDQCVACPDLIKFRFMKEFQDARAEMDRQGKIHREHVLFALQPRIQGILNRPSIRFSTSQTLEYLVPVAQVLESVFQKRLLLRPHPGMARNVFMRDYSQSRIRHYADIDTTVSLAESMASASMVMSYDSTVLWEAGLAGIVPVSVQGPCFEGELMFPHEVLKVDRSLEVSLARLLSSEMAAKYPACSARTIFNVELAVRALAAQHYGA